MDEDERCELKVLRRQFAAMPLEVGKHQRLRLRIELSNLPLRLSIDPSQQVELDPLITLRPRFGMRMSVSANEPPRTQREPRIQTTQQRRHARSADQSQFPDETS